MTTSKDNNDIVAAHLSKREIEEVIQYPEHEKRTRSKTFLDAIQKLKNDGHYRCWISDKTEKLEAHHFSCEYSLENAVDFSKLKDVLMLFDFYGYSKAMKDIPITSVDDIRNLVVLNEEFHRMGDKGIHNTTFNAWIMQKIEKDNINVIPDENVDVDKDNSET